MTIRTLVLSLGCSNQRSVDLSGSNSTTATFWRVGVIFEERQYEKSARCSSGFDAASEYDRNSHGTGYALFFFWVWAYALLKYSQQLMHKASVHTAKMSSASVCRRHEDKGCCCKDPACRARLLIASLIHSWQRSDLYRNDGHYRISNSRMLFSQEKKRHPSILHR
jgi:hypothetical protein